MNQKLKSAALEQNIEKNECHDVETHFAFGENWSDYAAHISDQKIKQAEDGLLKLISASQLQGKTFLDIGCGSGLHSLAALKNGVASATCLDIDPMSVQTAQSVLGKFHDGKNYSIVTHNILEKEGFSEGPFDIVYSWGVLHHSGAMWSAVEAAAKYVSPEGLFVIALYKKSPLCGFWAFEKKIYTALPKWARILPDMLYAGALLSVKFLRGDNPVTYVREYHTRRGMRFMNDVRDWMGGYPYESASADEVQEKLKTMGFDLQESYNTANPKAFGLFGSGCAEYVFKKR